MPTSPTPEMITVEFEFLLERLSTRDEPSESESLGVGKVGMPPLSPRRWLTLATGYQSPHRVSCDKGRLLQ